MRWDCSVPAVPHRPTCVESAGPGRAGLRRWRGTRLLGSVGVGAALNSIITRGEFTWAWDIAIPVVLVTLVCGDLSPDPGDPRRTRGPGAGAG